MPKTLTNLSREAAQAQWLSNVSYWHLEGWTPNMEVKVVSERLRGHRTPIFRYVHHVRNNQTGAEWVDVVDKSGNTKSFKPHEVSLPVVRVKRKYTRKN